MISEGTPVAKATCWTSSDAEARKLGEQTGLDTPVVLALNDGYLVVDLIWVYSRSKSVKYPAWGVWSQG